MSWNQSYHRRFHESAQDRGKLHGNPDMMHYQKVVRQTDTHGPDPRDLVYSLLSLITQDEARIIGSNYGITTSQVYAKATYASFIVRQNFDMLIGKHVQSLEELPSWAFDFSAPPPSITLPTAITFASEIPSLPGGLVNLDTDLLTVHVRGHLFDDIGSFMDLKTRERSIASRFESAFFAIFRDLRTVAKDRTHHDDFQSRLSCLLTAIPDPDLDRWQTQHPFERSYLLLCYSTGTSYLTCLSHFTLAKTFGTI